LLRAERTAGRPFAKPRETPLVLAQSKQEAAIRGLAIQARGVVGCPGSGLDNVGEALSRRPSVSGPSLVLLQELN
jgi:hypothetical protein